MIFPRKVTNISPTLAAASSPSYSLQQGQIKKCFHLPYICKRRSNLGVVSDLRGGWCSRVGLDSPNLSRLSYQAVGTSRLLTSWRHNAQWLLIFSANRQPLTCNTPHKARNSTKVSRPWGPECAVLLPLFCCFLTLGDIVYTCWSLCDLQRCENRKPPRSNRPGVFTLLPPLQLGQSSLCQID